MRPAGAAEAKAATPMAPGALPALPGGSPVRPVNALGRPLAGAEGQRASKPLGEAGARGGARRRPCVRPLLLEPPSVHHVPGTRRAVKGHRPHAGLRGGLAIDSSSQRAAGFEEALVALGRAAAQAAALRDVVANLADSNELRLQPTGTQSRWWSLVLRVVCQHVNPSVCNRFGVAGRV